MIELREYQREAIEAYERAWNEGIQRPAIVLPTGAGKTVIMAHGIVRAQAWEGGRDLVVAHRTELIEQTAAKLRDVAPDGMSVGIVKAERNETLARVVVGSVQTLASDFRRRQLYDVRRVTIDECHHATARTYVKLLDHYGCMREGGARALGVTATMSRGDTATLGDVWQDVVYERSIAWMISNSWLVRPRGVRVRVQGLDLSSVARSRGDYREGALGQALEDALAPEAVAKAMSEHAPPGGRPTLLFAPTVRTAELFAEALTDAGYGVRVVTGATPADERRQHLQDFRDGKVQVLCNCMVLTEGTDLPMASCVVIARPTRHAGLYVQMVGRVLRLWPGKDDALVLDVVGASRRHGLGASIELFGETSALDVLDETLVERDETDTLDDDELTLDTIGEALDAGDVDDPSWINGPITSEIVDLFHGSGSAWLRTNAGVWFLRAGEWYIAILRSGAYGGTGYSVVRLHENAKRMNESRFVARDVSDLSYAMAYAESDVSPAERTTTARERGWRKLAPTEKQLAMARRYGIVANGATRGELSAQISVAAASWRIDPYLRPGML